MSVPLYGQYQAKRYLTLIIRNANDPYLVNFYQKGAFTPPQRRLVSAPFSFRFSLNRMPVAVTGDKFLLYKQHGGEDSDFFPSLDSP